MQHFRNLIRDALRRFAEIEKRARKVQSEFGGLKAATDILIESVARLSSEFSGQVEQESQRRTSAKVSMRKEIFLVMAVQYIRETTGSSHYEELGQVLDCCSRALGSKSIYSAERIRKVFDRYVATNGEVSNLQAVPDDRSPDQISLRSQILQLAFKERR
jgi:hypothetical protein